MGEVHERAGAGDKQESRNPSATLDDAGATWLGVNIYRVTVRERWRLSSGVGEFALWMLIGLIQPPIQHTGATAREFLWVDMSDDVPPWAATLFARTGERLATCDLEPVMTYSTRSLQRQVPLAQVWMAADGLELAQVMAIPTPDGIKLPRAVVSCTSLTADGDTLVTSNNAKHFDQDARVRLEVVEGDAVAVYRRHRARLASLDVVPCARDAVRARLADEHAQSVAYFARRGLHVPLDARQVAGLRATLFGEAPSPALASGPASRKPIPWRMILSIVVVAGLWWWFSR